MACRWEVVQHVQNVRLDEFVIMPNHMRSNVRLVGADEEAVAALRVHALRTGWMEGCNIRCVYVM